MISAATEDVTRFASNADQETRRAFARDLIAKLDKLGVKPGGKFVVLAAEEFERVEREHDKMAEELTLAEADTEERERLEERILDFSRGIVTAAELIESAGGRELSIA